MAGDNNHGRFSFSTIYNYIKDGIYPDGFSKSDKGSLRKKAKFFFTKEADLFYKSSKQCTGKH